MEEIAAWFNCSPDTVERWVEATYNKKFAEIFQEKRGLGRVSLRRRQWQDALAGNVTLQIWLGKQHLGQSDKSQQEVINWNKAHDELEREVFEKSQLLLEHLKNKETDEQTS
jgi:hypothetical protein